MAWVVITQLSSQGWELDILDSHTRICYPKRIILSVYTVKLHLRSNISWWNVHSYWWKDQSISLLLCSVTSLNMSILLLLSTLLKIFTFMITYSFMFFRCQCWFLVLRCCYVLLTFIIPSWFYPLLLIAIFFFLILLLTYDGIQWLTLCWCSIKKLLTLLRLILTWLNCLCTFWTTGRLKELHPSFGSLQCYFLFC